MRESVRGGAICFSVYLFLLYNFSTCLAQVHLPPPTPGGNSRVPLSTRLSLSSTHGVPLPTPTGGFPASHGNVGVPLSTAGTRGQSSTFGGAGFGPTVTSFGVPLKTTTGAGGFTTLGVSGPIVQSTVGRGIQETKPQGSFGLNSFHINELPTSIELDKNISPVPPYFVFSDDDSSAGSLTIGGPKTGGLLPIANPTSDPKLLRLLSQPTVRQRLVAEARADKALKITSILMAHRQVVGGQISYVSLRLSETNCPAHRINSLRGCNIAPDQDTYICEVAFWERPWLNVTRMLDEKTACAETEDDADFDADVHREVGGLRGVIEGDDVGGVWSQTTTLPQGLSQQQLAVEAFNHVDAHSDSNFRGYLAGHTVHSVLVDRARNLTKVQVWVDYGFTICLKLDWTKGGQKDPRNCPVDATRALYSCALSLLYHPSQLMPLRVVNGGDKDELKCNKKTMTTTSTATSSMSGKELQGCAGCPVQAALSDPAILSMLNFAMQEYDIMYSDDDNIHKPVSLLSAYTQATAGTKYVLTVEVSETVCRKGVPGIDRTKCAADPTEENEVCIFIVLHQPWLPSSHLLSAKCFDKDESHKYQQQQNLHLPSPTAPRPTTAGAGGAPHTGHGVALPAFNNLKPLHLSFSGKRNTSTGLSTFDAKTNQVVQFVVEQINKRSLADDAESRERDDDSREFDDSKESREFSSGHDSDGYYKLVKVHTVSPVNERKQQRLVLELGETNCNHNVAARQATRQCTLDPFEEHEVCDAIVTHSNTGVFRLTAISCEDLGDYLEESSIVPQVPTVTWEPTPFLPVGAAAGRPLSHTGYNSGVTGAYAGMRPASTTDAVVRKAGELVVARYNLLSGEDELARLSGVLTAHTMSNVGGSMQYLLEVEMSETICKKYLPIIDQSKCPIDPSEDKIVCQAEVQQQQVGQHQGQQQAAWDGLTVNKLYCREREDYIITRSTGQDGPWTVLSASDPKLRKLAAFTAAQYDIRSDDDDLFKLTKIVSGKYQNVSGIRYDVVVELSETVCPKYKDHINKDRCRVDPTEDVKLCNAQLFEPASGANGLTVTKLQCRDKQDPRKPSSNEHSNEILVLPSVHPSAHARPIFLKKFQKQTFRVRIDDSGESLESNEQFYNHPRAPGSRTGGGHGGRRGGDDSRSEEDSDEFLPRGLRTWGR